jgi:hypothetical protein
MKYILALISVIGLGINALAQDGLQSGEMPDTTLVEKPLEKPVKTISKAKQKKASSKVNKKANAGEPTPNK